MPKFLKLFVFLLVFTVLSFGCKDDVQQKNLPFDTLFSLSIDNVNFQAQIAIEDTEKAKGLMFRESMPENQGMLFVNKTPQKVSYWMKNTKIPLDIAFIDKNGVITEIRQMYPLNLNAVSSIREDILYCLEMNQGWFAKNNLKSSDKIDIKLLENAIISR